MKKSTIGLLGAAAGAIVVAVCVEYRLMDEQLRANTLMIQQNSAYVKALNRISRVIMDPCSSKSDIEDALEEERAFICITDDDDGENEDLWELGQKFFNEG